MASSNNTGPGTSSFFVSSSVSPSAEPTESSAASSPTPTLTPTSTPPPSSTPPLTESSSASPTAPSSTPVTLPSSTPPPQSSTPPPASSSAPASSNPPATSVVTASSRPPSTQVITSFITPSASIPGETPSVIVVTSVITNSDTPQLTTGSPAGSAAPSSSSSPPSLQGLDGKQKSGGLNAGGKTAIAVVIPVVVVAALVLAGIFLWRKRKQRKSAEEARRKEVEEYGFNPNNDPTLPAVGMATEMAEDQSGYRGWGNTTTSSNRKASTTLNSGMTYSDGGSNPGGPGSPTQGTYSDGHSVDPLLNGRRETLDSEGISALGAGPNANQNRSDIHRGPSNASSSYSAANRSDTSGDYPIPVNNPQEYYDSNGYYQPGPYGDNGYSGGQQPVIRDVSARRNTRIENPSVFPQQGNSGIAQNF
ncbi:uncharacterized protein BDR25DRAFT_21034 [Lindgomyces ingoldianus]|uniref:Uncharacterized protein n=1 Tax=Lindgomyces ingoldianus TaxID=673940 RepID=A0ACB6QXB7_9PLEO|nr:uncharacterized protein BDR25DRAFT_21034 [Lindgomyces ingoldianus]KAF2471556.1 hypothetical protein BDR25DRAFT_21034 [Lindgomyces ingoldianus]